MEKVTEHQKPGKDQHLMEEPKIRVGISSCLLGMKVRFDGGHKHDNYLTQTLGRYFEWVPVCPEVEIGMSIPRENIRLVGAINDPYLIGPKSGTDYTDRMKSYSRERVEELAALSLHAYILKKGSPSCGMERVRVYDKNNVPSRDGVGIFARFLMERFPLLPVEEEGRLNDPRLRENFIERVFAYQRLQELLQNRLKPGDLVQFHTRHKLTLMSHSVAHYKEIGQLVATAGNSDFPALLEEYSRQFTTILAVKATTRKHTNVLHHIIGYFKKLLDAPDKQELLEVIEQYRNHYLPLVVPLTLINHHLRRHPIPWMQEQVYLNPYPAELMLRNFV